MFYFQNLFLHSCFDRLSCLGSRVYRHASGQMRRMRSLPPIVHSHSLPSASVIQRRPSCVDVPLVKRYRAYSPTNFKTPAFSRDIQRVRQKLTGITCFFFLSSTQVNGKCDVLSERAILCLIYVATNVLNRKQFGAFDFIIWIPFSRYVSHL